MRKPVALLRAMDAVASVVQIEVQFPVEVDKNAPKKARKCGFLEKVNKYAP
jgi:hypothetical protein